MQAYPNLSMQSYTDICSRMQKYDRSKFGVSCKKASCDGYLIKLYYYKVVNKLLKFVSFFYLSFVPSFCPTDVVVISISNIC